jgi:hypothetical protein
MTRLGLLLRKVTSNPGSFIASLMADSERETISPNSCCSSTAVRNSHREGESLELYPAEMIFLPVPLFSQPPAQKNPVSVPVPEFRQDFERSLLCVFFSFYASFPTH